VLDPRGATVKNLTLERALCFFDLETTGADVASDRIVELCLLRIDASGATEARTRRVNPGRPIPPEATAIHGIRDEDVANEPPFRELARGLLEFVGDADLAGFNVQRFDVPLLDREFREAGLDLKLSSRLVVDAMTIFHRKEPRHLSAAVRFYLDREHVGAHGAEADVLATAEVLDAQLARYPDLPRSVRELDAWCRPPGDPVDVSGKFVWKNGEVVFAFGPHRGRRLRDVASDSNTKGFLDWILRKDFPEDAKRLAKDALAGKFPEPRR